jgi:protein TonB
MKRISMMFLAATLLGTAFTSRARTDAPIEQTLDRNKGAMYALYARELRVNPTLKGKIVFEIDIAADGLTTACRVRSSELNAPEFEGKLCARIKLIRFPPRNAPTTYPKQIEFFPAA